MNFSIRPTSDGKRSVIEVNAIDATLIQTVNKIHHACAGVVFYTSIASNALTDLSGDVSLNVSVSGDEVRDLSGLQNTKAKIHTLNIQMGVNKTGVKNMSVSQVNGLENLNIAYLDGIQLSGLKGSSLSRLVIEEIGNYRKSHSLNGLHNLTHLRIMKMGGVTELDISTSKMLEHLVLLRGKRLRSVRLPEKLAGLKFLAIEKITMEAVMGLAKTYPQEVCLEVNDIFSSKESAEMIFPRSKILL